jgi:hypothetical protein|tara:strand:- start:47 stop:205 length:159 start_codon:yes stop_codon:yes gene_type:complete
MQLTENKMIDIIKSNKINLCTKEEQKQIMCFAFGEKYISSNDKGSLKKYKEQ